MDRDLRQELIDKLRKKLRYGIGIRQAIKFLERVPRGARFTVDAGMPPEVDPRVVGEVYYIGQHAADALVSVGLSVHCVGPFPEA